MRISLYIQAAALLSLTSLLYSAESKTAEKPGIKALQLGTEIDSIQPGNPFSIGLFIQHLPEYHTYWKAPGIVGVPTSITWDLPNNFVASDIQWPVPELTKMAQYKCYGYEQDVCLLSEITVPEEIEADSVTLKARVAFMCCSKTCHPGWHDFELTLPVNRTAKREVDRKWQKRFAQTRSNLSVRSPKDWSIRAFESEKEIKVMLVAQSKPFLKGDEIYCFCEDNQINSDLPQTLEWSKDKKQLTLSLQKSGFGPKNLKKFSGLLYHPVGWPGTSSKWISISAPLSSS